MLKVVLENRKWFGFAVAVAVGIFYFFFGQHAPTTTASPAAEMNSVNSGLLSPPLLKNVSKKTREVSIHTLPITRSPSAQKTPAPDHLMEHALLAQTPWKIWMGVKAISTEHKIDTDVVLAKLNQIFIVEYPNESPNLTEFSLTAPIAVYDGRLKKTGLINGLVKIQTTNRAQLEVDLLDMRARIAEAFEPIHTYFVTGTDSTFDLEALYQNLKSKHYIKSTNLDITSRSYEKF